MAELLPWRATWMKDLCNWQPLVYIPGLEPPPRFAPDASCLQRDTQPCLYLYRQSQQMCHRIGVMGLLQVSDSRVLPHEETIATGVEACCHERRMLCAETSSLFLWCDDPLGSLYDILDAPITPVFRRYQDRFGCSHELTRISDPQLIVHIGACLRDRILYLADGHHRFAAGWQLATIQLRSASLRPHPDAPADALADLEAAARARRLLPPKSTDFQPKLAARLLWHEI